MIFFEKKIRLTEIQTSAQLNSDVDVDTDEDGNKV